jgi:hypothetical protein
MQICEFQLKYNDAGKEKECLPQVGQWNMVNKVRLYFAAVYFAAVCMPQAPFMMLDTLFTNKINSIFSRK